MPALRFLLNGQVRAEEGVPPTMTVLDWLRTRARLTGTKEGCAEGDCGACTIALARPRRDGEARWEAVNSCLMMLPQIDGCAMLTVEGLSQPDAPLHPVQQALVDADATQCGYCTPGFAMAMFAFQQGGEPAENHVIHEALAGNLCRCTGYRSIVDACRNLAYGRAGGTGEIAVGLPQTSATSGSYACGPQQFLTPASLDELLALRARHPDALILAGGTDLGLRVSKRREALPMVISTANVPELRFARERDGGLEIGAACTYTQALPLIDRRFPSFAELIRRIGSRQIRNLGTFAGNLVTASPIGDTLPCLMALDAEVTLRSRDGARTLAVEDFITGYRTTALAPDEIVESIRIPFVSADQHFVAYKLSKRFDQDISTVVAAFRLALADGAVADFCAAFGGMAARPARAAHLEAALQGRPWSGEALGDADTLLSKDFEPLSDFRASAAYRLRAAAGLVRRFQMETGLVTAPIRLEAL